MSGGFLFLFFNAFFRGCTPWKHLLEGITLSIGFRPPPDRIPSAVRSDSVRRPIGFRPPSDRIPSAVRSDSVRRPVGYLETQPAKYRAFALILLNI